MYFCGPNLVSMTRTAASISASVPPFVGSLCNRSGSKFPCTCFGVVPRAAASAAKQALASSPAITRSTVITSYPAFCIASRPYAPASRANPNNGTSGCFCLISTAILSMHG